jgi:hypothetical protein
MVTEEVLFVIDVLFGRSPPPRPGLVLVLFWCGVVLWKGGVVLGRSPRPRPCVMFLVSMIY